MLFMCFNLDNISLVLPSPPIFSSPLSLFLCHTHSHTHIHAHTHTCLHSPVHTHTHMPPIRSYAYVKIFKKLDPLSEEEWSKCRLEHYAYMDHFHYDIEIDLLFSGSQPISSVSCFITVSNNLLFFWMQITFRST